MDTNNIEVTTTPEEEWIWIEGYKGTDKDMRCRGYQYELCKRFDIPDESKIKTCSSGFHLCLNLRNVYRYYPVEMGNRFFKVRALVSKKDYETTSNTLHGDKIAAKSIIFESELTPDDIFRGTVVEDWSEEDKRLAIVVGVDEAKIARDARVLSELGFSKPLAHMLSKTEYSFEVAEAFGSQEDLSMDMKVFAIMSMLTGTNCISRIDAMKRRR